MGIYVVTNDGIVSTFGTLTAALIFASMTGGDFVGELVAS